MGLVSESETLILLGGESRCGVAVVDDQVVKVRFKAQFDLYRSRFLSCYKPNWIVE
jgi:hypothetical protein